MTDRQRPVHPPGAVRRFFQRGSWPEASFVADVLRTETVGGVLLLLGAVIALGWANSPWSDSYLALGRYVPWSGGDVVHLDLSLGGWAGDGLLAIFFFVVGLELKREFVVGDLRDPRRAVVPVLAALGGMALPALIYVAVIAATGSGAYAGWAIPMATDIAFALAVLAVIGSHLPHGLRAFLLTLAVVDDLIAILVIALFYTDHLSPAPLLGALATIGVFGVLVQRRWTRWWILLPLGVLSWILMHASGVHATVAGVLLGFTVPVLTRPGERRRLAEHFEHRWRPVSAGAAVPIFAFFAAGVALRDADPGGLIREPIVLGVAAGLIVGKTLGIFGATYLLSRFTRAELDEGIGWSDLFGVALLAGIGFTVSLLIGELAFGSEGEEHVLVKAAVLAGSLISAVLASLVLTLRNAKHRRLHEAESRDEDADGVPDVYQRPEPDGRHPGEAD